MKKPFLLSLTFLFSIIMQVSATEADTTNRDAEAALVAQYVRMDSINKSLKYEHGVIKLKNSAATLSIPDGFKYLDAEQSEIVLTELWGNPKGSSSLGMIFPEDRGPLSDNSWAFDVQYDEIGFVKDDDADDINYDELLTDLQKETNEANGQRVKEGYEPLQLIGWAQKPFYDKDKKILHWAKEIKFGTSEENTLNYNVRILGRKGVLILNAIGSMPQLPEISKNIPKVLNIVEFTDGNKYSDFNPDIDEVAAWTIGGLVAGKVLAKVGLFALLLKFWKVGAIAVAGAGSFIWKKFTGKKDGENA
jgi:uncharacterized membrane-anchored protein